MHLHGITMPHITSVTQSPSNAQAYAQAHAHARTHILLISLPLVPQTRRTSILWAMPNSTREVFVRWEASRLPQQDTLFQASASCKVGKRQRTEWWRTRDWVPKDVGEENSMMDQRKRKCEDQQDMRQASTNRSLRCSRKVTRNRRTQIQIRIKWYKHLVRIWPGIQKMKRQQTS